MQPALRVNFSPRTSEEDGGHAVQWESCKKNLLSSFDIGLVLGKVVEIASADGYL